MVISIDKFTSVKMYDKVQKYWKEEIKRLIGLIGETSDESQKLRLQKSSITCDRLRWLSLSVKKPEKKNDLPDRGLESSPTVRKSMSLMQTATISNTVSKSLKDKLQIVFVCAMWLTGFDAHTVSTLYMDKPMKDHTLMQTIARANRVTSL